VGDQPHGLSAKCYLLVHRLPGMGEENGEHVIVNLPVRQEMFYVKMRLYQVLPFSWCVVAALLAGRTISSVLWRCLIGSISGTENYFN
jgi:hypothetical protein